MPRRSISLLSSLLFLLLLFTPTILADSEQQFQELVRDVPEDRLHAALHDYNGAKFKHVKLAKRQSNTTTTRNSVSTTPGSTVRPTTPTTLVTTAPSSTSQAARPTTSASDSKSTAAPPSTTKGTISTTSKVTRTVTGPDGVSTLTESTVVVATPTDESSPPPPEGTTTSTTGGGTPGLQNVGLRVSGGDSAIVAVIAALGFFML